MDFLKVLDETAEHVKNTVTPLLKSPIAGKTYGIGAGGDAKKHIDLEAEKAVINTLQDKGLEFTLISEETGIQRYGSKPDYYVTTDPIDGTTNLLRGIPFACSSIAISATACLESIEAGVVVDLFHSTTYLAQRNRGAFRNSERVEPAQIDNLDDAVVGVDINSCDTSPSLVQLLGQMKHVRHLGANALELCYVADGTTDGFIDVRGKLRTTDIAAAILIIEESGAIITDLRGAPISGPLSPTATVDFIAAGSQPLHQKILTALGTDQAHDDSD
jgi:myo-inositol-1(or 4)-monophosphatase